MPQVSVSHLTFSYSASAIDILKDVSLSLLRGWYGVVGPNGSGKTNLLKGLVFLSVVCLVSVIVSPTRSVFVP